MEIGCDVCGEILRRGGMKTHRMSLKCKALVNIKLYLSYNLFEFNCDNIYKLRHTTMYGDFENCFYKLIDEDRKQRIVIDWTICTFINGQLEIKHKMTSKRGGVCEKVMNT